MNAIPRPAVAGLDAGAAEPAADSIGALAADAADVMSAWAVLLTRELALAQRSLRWLLIGTIIATVAALGMWMSLSALLVAFAKLYTDSWVMALLLGTGLQALALAMLLRQLRSWARELSLPQSRAALVHAMEGMS